jgi:uncharacterized cofD-like protein
MKEHPTTKSSALRPPVEHLVEAILGGSVLPADLPRGVSEVTRRLARLDAGRTRVVVLGGGTGLSTVVGGNSQSTDWSEHPFVGLKQEFPRLDVIVCTTDDGGSTGLLLRQLPMIGIGDLRKSCLSLVLADNLRRTYGLDERGVRKLVRVIQRVFNHRFTGKPGEQAVVRDPLRAVPPAWRRACPPSLAAAFRRLGRRVSPGGDGPVIPPAGHCLGNLLLTAAVFPPAPRGTWRAPGPADMKAGIDEMCSLIGATPGRLHAATAAPGQLRFRYTNGVEVCGQRKSSLARRGFAVENVTAEFAAKPGVNASVRRALREADLIIFAPGSLYTSMIPLLQVPAIASAIRGNRRALKILAANFWVQEGETDISPGGEGRGFLVSELIEAYDKNVPGGIAGLFHVVLSANLENMPGDILRNYALEGKRPIHLDRGRVMGMGVQPVEATLFSPGHLRVSRVIHHDAARFALGARRFLKGLPGANLSRGRVPASGGAVAREPILSAHQSRVESELRRKQFRPAMLRQVMLDLAWENRDIHPRHLRCFAGVRVIRRAQWHRSTEWDNVLGYYDPADRFIKLHEDLVRRPSRLRQDLLIALGESLLGRYIEARRWVQGSDLGVRDARCYEIRLRPVGRRHSVLSDAQLRVYLKLARMVQDPDDPRLFRITINNQEGFLPPGLLFGLLYAWYLDNAYGGIMEYEMSLLKWPPRSLIPHQAKERIRKQALVTFFCNEVFGRSPRP